MAKKFGLFGSILAIAGLIALCFPISASATPTIPTSSNSVLGTWINGTTLKYYAGTANELTITVSAPRKQGYTTSMPMAHSSIWGGATSLTSAYTPNSSVIASNGLGLKYLSTQMTAAEKITALTTPVPFDTVTFTFSRPVEDAVMHINNLGGWNAATMYSQWRIQGGKTMTMLSGQGNFQVANNATIKTNVAPTESKTTATGTGSGTVQIPGVYSSVTFAMDLSCNPTCSPTGGIPEGVSFQWSLPSVYVAPTPPAPSAVNDATTTAPSTPVNLSPLDNDETGSGLLTNSLKLCATGQTGSGCAVTTTTSTADGTWAINQGTSVATFTPANGFTGVATLPYVFQDTNANLVSAVMSVTVAAPAPPQAIDDSETTTPATPVTLDILANDNVGTGVAAGTLKLCATGQSNSTCAVTTSTTTSSGNWVLNSGTNDVTYTPANGFTGTATLPYVFQDAQANLTQADMSVVVASATPSAVNDSASTTPAVPVQLNIFTNDNFGVNGYGTGSLKLCQAGQSAASCASSTVTTADGTWTITSGPNDVRFTPASGFTGTTTLNYAFADGAANIVGAQMTVVVSAPTTSAANLAMTGSKTGIQFLFGLVLLGAGIVLRIARKGVLR